MSDTLVLNGNPKQNSFCKSLAESYAQGAIEGGRNLRMIHISDLNFELNLTNGYDEKQELEPDLLTVRDAISDASHLVIVCPVWWGTMPAKLKGLFDRVLLPGFAFKHKEGMPYPVKLLQGKTARLILTMDSPIWYFRFVLGDPLVKTLNKPTFGLCGIKVKAVNRFGPVVGSGKTVRSRWIHVARKAGVTDSSKK